MCALRVSVVATVTMALVGGLSVGLVAQEEHEVETPTATYVTGTIIQSFESGDSESWAEADEPPRLLIYGLMALTGEGVYEGLSAMIANTWKGSTPALEGYIFEGDLPPMPDPIDPNTPPVE